MLLDIDIFNDDNDLLQNFPSAAKSEVSFLHEDVSTLYPPSPPETKPNPAELANDLLQQLDTECKQENLFSNWLEEKVDLPIFENIPQGVVSPPVPLYIPPPAAPVQAPVTEDLLREFDTVYGVVELTHLTPPQSPPGPATQLLVSYAQQAQSAQPDPWHLHQLQPACEYPTYEDGLVDELVRSRAAQLPSLQSGSSLSSSPPSSPRSSTDEEWSSSGSRPKPYSRHSDDRRSRKKEQNKNAATRYRQKKKAEVEVLLGEESTLRQRHGELGDKCSDLQREIRYLKGLMRDLFKAKGLIK